uniref:Uncharacterized protein n=1 Tax=Coccidioides posadasii RMSCC 3488 TaxID=454284 RepID=A0A0J6F8Q1_COCPO|nr:hypothetical protein CPAG_01980 [Coccidioides posadasii RMSCC 3488]
MRGGSSLRGRPTAVCQPSRIHFARRRSPRRSKPVESTLCPFALGSRRLEGPDCVEGQKDLNVESQGGLTSYMPSCFGNFWAGRSPIEPETTPYFTHWEAQAAYPGAASICKGAHLAGNYSMHPFAEPRARFLP